MNNIFNIVVTENYKNKKNEDKTSYTTVGTAFYNKDSNSFSCRIKPGIALTNEFVLFERRAKDENAKAK
ncbi:MAG: hypothetical protein QM478_11615 [Flavobacteriaceae bacterium]